MACSPFERDVPRRDGGTSPDPTAVFSGTLRYRGGKPLCQRSSDGVATRVRGVFIAFLYDERMPPPPFGRGAAISTLAWNASQLFDLSDCDLDDAATLDRAAPLLWAEIPLADDGERRYQVRALFDRNENFLPQFRTRSRTDTGDVIGAAFEADGVLLRSIAVASRATRPLGQRVVGVDVSLERIVQTESPMFALESSALESSATMPAPAYEDAIFALTQAQLHTLNADDLDHGESVLEGWNAAGTAPQPSAARGFYFTPIDANRDGAPDPHPFLAQQLWVAPWVRFTRAKTPAERAAGLPDIEIIGTVRASVFPARAGAKDAQLLVAPIATMHAVGADARCDFRIVPPGNLAELYETGASDCQVLPSGNYDVLLWSGLVGAPLMADSNVSRSDTGYSFDPTRSFFSAQSWAIPNELGCPDIRYDRNAQNQLDRDPTLGCPLAAENEASLQLPGQGREGSFSVVDTHAELLPQALDVSDGHGQISCQEARAQNNMVRRVQYAAVAQDCCAPYRRFCNLPLCATNTDGAVRSAQDGNRQIREATTLANGSMELLCVPFAMPAVCCR